MLCSKLPKLAGAGLYCSNSKNSANAVLKSIHLQVKKCFGFFQNFESDTFDCMFKYGNLYSKQSKEFEHFQKNLNIP